MPSKENWALKHVVVGVLVLSLMVPGATFTLADHHTTDYDVHIANLSDHGTLIGTGPEQRAIRGISRTNGDVPSPGFPLTVDPGLKFSTLFGGSGSENGLGMTLDDNGDIFVTASTTSYDIPTIGGAYCDTYAGGGYDIVVAKFNSNASQLLACTYLGGGDIEYPYQIKIGENGSVLIVGETYSTDFPVSTNAYCSTAGGNIDGFIVMLDNNLTTLQYSSYLGGSERDVMTDLEPLPGGNIAIVGYSGSDDFPVTDGAYCTTYNGGMYDIVVMNLSMDRGELEFSTYIGGTNSDNTHIGSAILVDDQGDYIVAGHTNSTDVEIPAIPFDNSHNGAYDALIFRLAKDGAKVEAGTFLGGADNDYSHSLMLDGRNRILLVGSTSSINFPVTNDAYQGSEDRGAGTDGFISILDLNLTALNYSSYIGGNHNDWLWGIHLEDDDRLTLMGDTLSDDILMPTTGHDTTFDEPADGFLLSINISNGRPINGTYFGGYGSDRVYGGMEFSPNIGLIVSGGTWSLNFPTTPGAYDPIGQGQGDCYIFAILMGNTPWDLPTAPRNLSVAPGNGSIHMEWAPPANDGCWPIERYRLYFFEENGTVSYCDTRGPGINCTYLGFLNGRRYRVAVSAITTVGEGPRTGLVEVVPFSEPSSPTNLVVTGGFGNVTLSWASPRIWGGARIAGYTIYRGMDTTSLSRFVQLGNVTSYVDEDVESGTIYFYQVHAWNEFTNGSLSLVMWATPYGVPTPPLNLSAEPGDAEVVLTWSPPLSSGGLEIRQYRIYRGTSPDDLQAINSIEGVTSYHDTDLMNGRTYY